MGNRNRPVNVPHCEHVPRGENSTMMDGSATVTESARFAGSGFHTDTGGRTSSNVAETSAMNPLPIGVMVHAD